MASTGLGIVGGYFTAAAMLGHTPLNLVIMAHTTTWAVINGAAGYYIGYKASDYFADNLQNNN